MIETATGLSQKLNTELSELREEPGFYLGFIVWGRSPEWV